MMEKNKAELYLEVKVEDATDEELDRFTRQLLSELNDSKDVESAELIRSDSLPEGAKGDMTLIGSIALQMLPSAIPSVLNLVQAWITRGQGRTVKFKGEGIEFEGSAEDLHRLLETLEERRKKT